jgi:hypothetical protein
MSDTPFRFVDNFGGIYYWDPSLDRYMLQGPPRPTPRQLRVLALVGVAWTVLAVASTAALTTYMGNRR